MWVSAASVVSGNVPCRFSPLKKKGKTALFLDVTETAFLTDALQNKVFYISRLGGCGHEMFTTKITVLEGKRKYFSSHEQIVLTIHRMRH